MHIETLAVHGRNLRSTTSGDVAPALHLATTFARDEEGASRDGMVYARTDTPNRRALERSLAALEGGAHAIALPSGSAAVTALLAAMPAGGRVTLPGDLYFGTRHLVHQLGPRFDLVVDERDPRDLVAGESRLEPGPGLLWIETPSNPNLDVADIAALSSLAHEAGRLVACDSTWATPVLQRPLSLGVDAVVHSTTKYLGGHSDLLGGVVILGAESAELAESVRRWQTVAGAVPGAFDCWLLARSLATVPLRVLAHSAGACAVARALESHPRLERVAYPGLASHPQHAVAARQMHGGFGGMLSIVVEGGREAAFEVARRLELFTRATSLGGVESLVEHRASVEGEGSRAPEGLLRLSIGLEHPDDLIADLLAALHG